MGGSAMTEIAEAIAIYALVCAGAFNVGLFLTPGAVIGFKCGVRWFGPITKSVTINGPVPVVIRERE